MENKVLVKNIIPLGVDIIVTAEKADTLPSGLIMPETSNTVKPIQKVIAVAVNEHNVSAGDLIEIDPETFPHKNVPAKHDTGPDTKGKIILPIYKDDEGVEFMKITSRNILWGIKSEDNE